MTAVKQGLVAGSDRMAPFIWWYQESPKTKITRQSQFSRRPREESFRQRGFQHKGPEMGTSVVYLRDRKNLRVASGP